MTWIPEWRVTVGDDVYTTVTSVSYSTGRKDIDKQATAGYCRVEIINTTGAPFTINLAETIMIELKDTNDQYITMFTGKVSDFTASVRSPEESGFITTGTILGVGNLAKLTKSVYPSAVAEGLDGAQIATILGQVLSGTWNEVFPTLTWDDYYFVPWENAENYVGRIDDGEYTMTSLAANATVRADTLVYQIANSGLGQIYENNFGLICYDQANRRESQANQGTGYIPLDGTYANFNNIRSTLQTNRMRNSLIYKYGAGYASSYSTSNTDSIGRYGTFERTYESNIKNLGDITSIAALELYRRAYPQYQIEAISFRMDNPTLPDALIEKLINVYFGQPVEIQNIPYELVGANSLRGFIEDITFKATPTYADLTIFVSDLRYSTE